MVPHSEKVLDIIEEAIYHEQASHDYYLQVVEAMHDESGRQQFRHLAQEEIRHRAVLEDRFRSLTGKRFRFDPKKLRPDPVPVPRSNASAIQALALAMEHELEAVENYRKLAEGAEDAESRRTYLQLAEDERGHYEWFRTQRQALLSGVHWFTETLPGTLDR
jgi:rubrerythrin